MSHRLLNRCPGADRRARLAGVHNERVTATSQRGSDQWWTGRTVRLIAGWFLLVAGVSALILPGPGLLLVAAGLTILAQQYDWAKRRLKPVKAKALELAEASVQSLVRVALSLLSAAVVIAIGIFWGVRPAPPRFWPLAEQWWLPGGWGTGSSLIGSGVIAVGLLVYSYHRFSDHDAK